MRHGLAALLLLALCVAAILPVRAEEVRPASIAERTRVWLSRLPPQQRGRTLHAFAAQERTNWHYVPRGRSGLALRSMGAAERKQALELFASVLGSAHWAKAQAVFRLEAILRRQAVAANPNTPASWRDPLLYFVSVFGTPREEGAWGLRLEGHHLSINLTFEGATLRSSTPLFFGANPASARTPDGTLLRPLGQEEDLAVRLITSLDATQRRRAVTGGCVPGDVVFGPSRAVAMTRGGLEAAALTPAQRASLRALVDAHRLGAPIGNEELGTARLLWMGGMRAGGALYYRIEAPTFLLEFRNLGSHVHCLWRDPRGDFGGR